MKATRALAVALTLIFHAGIAFAKGLPQPFEEICSLVTPRPEHYRCGGPLEHLLCEFLRPSASPGLEPPLPMMECIHVTTRSGQEKERVAPEGVFRRSGIGWNYGSVYTHTYVIHRNGRFEHLQSREDFRAVFAPIKTGKQAVAFAQASGFGDVITNAWKLRFMWGGSYRVWRWTIRATRPRREKDGFLVNLYSRHQLGVTETAVLIHFDGTVLPQASRRIWTDDHPVVF